MNAIFVLAHVVQLCAISALIWNIAKARTCSGVSAKTQLLLLLVWLVKLAFSVTIYGAVMMALFALTTILILALIYTKFRSTYDRQQDSFHDVFLIIPCLVLSLVVNDGLTYIKVLQVFSCFLEAFAILPQVYMMTKLAPIPTYLSVYLTGLGLYRTLHIVGWIWQYFFDGYLDPIDVVSGCIQAILIWSFLVTFLLDGSAQKPEKACVVYALDKRPDTYVQDVSERLADIIFSNDASVRFALNDLGSEIQRRGIKIKNEKFKEHGYPNFKMFIEGQPWLVLFDKGKNWYVRRRNSHETRLARPLVDVNRHPAKMEEAIEEEDEKMEVVDDESFINPYEV